jgi:hypothetical protein
VITPQQLIWYLNSKDKLRRIDELADLLELGLIEAVPSSDNFQIVRTPAGDAAFFALATLAATLN